jgi:hypothetical protein
MLKRVYQFYNYTKEVYGEYDRFSKEGDDMLLVGYGSFDGQKV